ncbi:hypothetical protein C1645_746565 [Glomus cerebriforme]|uniref:Uncharacterized protein n=1 Tax=Glomus cerebriforme TaxID=658196 RepID=A0A397TX46_9GLOM|nr:hypothetical protein C1645_746565 [Glomus cerebriforme]
MLIMSNEQLYAKGEEGPLFDDFDNFQEKQEREDKIRKTLKYAASQRNVSENNTLSQMTKMAIEKGREIFQIPRDYSHPIIKSAQYLWNNFPPLNWFGYGIVAFNIVPLTILIAFLIGTLTLVLCVSGTGILLAEGFFIGIGLLFFIPVATVLTFSAISTTFFTIFAWSVYKVAIYILRRIGLLEKEVQFDVRSAQREYESNVQEKEY